MLQLLLHVLKLRLRIHASRIRTVTHRLLSMNSIVERLLLRGHERLHGRIGAKVATLVELLCLLRMLLVLRLLLLLLLIHHGRMRRMRSGTWVHWRNILCLDRRMLRMLLLRMLRKRLVLLLRMLQLLRMLSVLLRMLTCCTLSARMQRTDARSRTYGSNTSRASRMLKSSGWLLRTQMGMCRTTRLLRMGLRRSEMLLSCSRLASWMLLLWLLLSNRLRNTRMMLLSKS